MKDTIENENKKIHDSMVEATKKMEEQRQKDRSEDMKKLEEIDKKTAAIPP